MSTRNTTWLSNIIFGNFLFFFATSLLYFNCFSPELNFTSLSFFFCLFAIFIPQRSLCIYSLCPPPQFLDVFSTLYSFFLYSLYSFSLSLSLPPPITSHRLMLCQIPQASTNHFPSLLWNRLNPVPPPFLSAVTPFSCFTYLYLFILAKAKFL